MPALPVSPAIQHVRAKEKAEKMSRMEEEGAAKWTEEQLAETMLEFSGKSNMGYFSSSLYR